MANKAEIVIKLGAAGQRQVVSAIGGVERGIRGVTSTIFSLKGALAGVGLGVLANEFVEAASTAEGFRSRLNVLLGSVAEGNRLFDLMAQYAGRVPFEYEEVMASATQLSGVMQGGVDEVTRWMPLIGDLAAASGLTIQEATDQVIRMYSAGAASADLFRERGILAMLGFEAGVSYSAEETRRRLVEAWEDPASKFRGATEEIADDWTGLLSMMGDKWFGFRNEVMDEGPFTFMKTSLAGVNDYLAQNTEKSEELARTLGVSVTNGLALVADGAGLTVQTFAGLSVVWGALEYNFLSFQETVWSGLHLIRSAVTDTLEAANVGGVLDNQLEESRRIQAEQEIILNQIALDKEAALAAGAQALTLYDQISEKVAAYRQIVEGARLSALGGGEATDDGSGLPGEPNAPAIFGEGGDMTPNEAELAQRFELNMALMEMENQKREFEENMIVERLRREKEAADERVRIEAELNQQVYGLRVAALNNAASLLRMFAGQSQAAAIAVIAIEKGLAIAQTFISGKAAEIRALAELGPIAGPPMAAKIAVWTKANMALIAATGLAQAAQAASGRQPVGYGAGTPNSPIVTADQLPAQQRQEEREPTRAYQIQFLGPIFGDEDEVARKMLDSFRKAEGDNA